MGRVQKKKITVKNENLTIPCTMFCCDRVFSTMKNLKKHMMYHAGIMPFMCFECGLAFRTQIGVDKHVEMNHGGESVDNLKNLKGFTMCNVCTAIIPSKQKRVHMETHIPC